MDENEQESMLFKCTRIGGICGCPHYFDSVVPRWSWGICISVSSIILSDTNAAVSGITLPESPWKSR